MNIEHPITPTLAHTYDPDKHDPTDMIMSEKLDGVRAIWDGTRFVSRTGKEFFAPEWFTKELPTNNILDGELYAGIGKFNDAVSKVRRHSDEWLGIEFVIFDCITSGNYRDRINAICTLPAHAHIHCDYLCTGVKHLSNFLSVIEGMGGEGVMLRDPSAHYEFKRTNALLKVKTFHDAEATVIGYSGGKGKYTNLTGALLCDWNGVEIKVASGLSDGERKDPPPVGSTITFGYFEVTAKGKPRFPTFIGVRDYE